jgi:hypothetical protein
MKMSDDGSARQHSSTRERTHAHTHTRTNVLYREEVVSLKTNDDVVCDVGVGKLVGLE